MIETFNREGERISSQEDEPPLSVMTKKDISLLKACHRYQMTGMCGPAMAQLLFRAGKAYQLREGILKPYESEKFVIPDQRDVARVTFSGPYMSPEDKSSLYKYVLEQDIPFYEEIATKVDCPPWGLAAYMGVPFHENMTSEDLFHDLNHGPVGVLWYMDAHNRDGYGAQGHYSLAVSYDEKQDLLWMLDTSTEERLYNERGVLRPFEPQKKSLWAGFSDNLNYHIRHYYAVPFSNYFEPRWADTSEEDNYHYNRVGMPINLATIRPPQNLDSAISQPVATL